MEISYSTSATYLRSTFPRRFDCGCRDLIERPERLVAGGELCYVQRQVRPHRKPRGIPFLLVYSLQRLSTRLQAEKSSKISNGDVEPILEFDKDDVDTLDFVTAAANLRSQTFDIEQKSKFDVKRILPNLVTKAKLTSRRNGREYHPSYSHNQCHDSSALCTAGVQGHEE